jgi:hypothetical protein
MILDRRQSNMGHAEMVTAIAAIQLGLPFGVQID